MELNQRGRPNIFVKSTGVPLNGPKVISSVSSPQNGHERKVFIVRGNMRIPAIAVPTNQPAQNAFSGSMEPIRTTAALPQLLEKDIKEEHIEEEAHGAMANITEFKPINLQDFMSSSFPPGVKSFPHLSKPLENEIKRESPPKLALRPNDTRSAADVPSSSLSNRVFLDADRSHDKRARKLIRYEDYVYDNSVMHDEAVDELQEPPAKRSRHVIQPDGCRCEYIVPELEQKMDRMMDKMHFIETLAKSMLAREQSQEVEKSLENSALNKAQNEIQQLRRQLIIQRNQKALVRPENK